MEKIFKMLAAILVIVGGAWAQTTVTTWEQLQSEITAFNNGTTNRTIIIGANININRFTLSGGAKTLTIRGNSTTRTLTRNQTGELINVEGSTTLILEDIVIDGNRNAFTGMNVLVRVDGRWVTNPRLEIRNGAILRNNIYDALFVCNGGTALMSNGTITNNGAGGVSVVMGTYADFLPEIQRTGVELA